MNMDTDDRVGSRDEDAARLFAAARAFRPSARTRRRTLRALGLPVGLSLVGPSLAHAAHLFTASLKGWGIVAGVVGAMSGVAYVASTPPSSFAPSHPAARARASRVGERHGASHGNKVTSAVASAPLPDAPAAIEAPAAEARTAAAAAAPAGVRAPSAPRALDNVPSAPKAARRSSTRPSSRTLPSDSPSTDDSPPPPVPSVEGPAERRLEVVPATEPSALVPQLSTRAIGGPVSRPSTPIPALSPAAPLRGELAIVAEAQSLLRAGNGPAARAVLDRHARVYPGGALAEEVEVLRLRALLADGDAPGARAAGETFLRRHPASPLGARVRWLLGDLDRSRHVPSPPLPSQTHGETL